ncbi:hypothetical protein ACFWPV_16605 [Streptomyces uncialis]|uniref:hypothetical protein n=1 Tax=Streptomyces uncialis TaxID=1048205 RepID=UPI00365C57CB
MPGFTVDEDNAAAVAAVCRRLDGLPLALELAATRMRMSGAAELADRLDDRFAVLADGRRAAPARQQTLHGVIDWSWELLTGAERTVLRKLSVYADGCTLEAAEAVCAGDGVRRSEVLGLLGQLVDRSLVVAVAGPRHGTGCWSPYTPTPTHANGSRSARTRSRAGPNGYGRGTTATTSNGPSARSPDCAATPNATGCAV